VVSASTDGTARIWRDGAGEAVVLGHDTAVITAAIRPDGTIVTGAADGVARIWDLGGALRTEVRAVVPAASGTNAPGDPAVAEPAGTGALVGPGGRVLAGGATRSTLFAAGDRPTSDLFGRPASTACNPFLPDGGVALVTGAGRLATYGPDGTRRWTILAHDGAIACATAGAAGDRIVTAGLDGAVRWWRASDGEMIGELRGPAPALQARWTPDGRVLLSAFADGVVRADPTDVRAALGRACATALRFGEHGAVAATCAGLARAKP
jgi:WD40 repeat protein